MKPVQDWESDPFCPQCTCRGGSFGARREVLKLEMGMAQHRARVERAKGEEGKTSFHCRQQREEPVCTFFPQVEDMSQRQGTRVTR